MSDIFRLDERLENGRKQWDNALRYGRLSLIPPYDLEDIMIYHYFNTKNNPIQGRTLSGEGFNVLCLLLYYSFELVCRRIDEGDIDDVLVQDLWPYVANHIIDHCMEEYQGIQPRAFLREIEVRVGYKQDPAKFQQEWELALYNRQRRQLALSKGVVRDTLFQQAADGIISRVELYDRLREIRISEQKELEAKWKPIKDAEYAYWQEMVSARQEKRRVREQRQPRTPKKDREILPNIWAQDFNLWIFEL